MGPNRGRNARSPERREERSLITSPRVAIVHDYLVERGGAERVTLALLAAFPGAPVYTSLYDPPRTYPEFRSVDVRTSFLGRLGIGATAYKMLLPFYPAAFASLDLSSFDVVISNTTGFAKGVRVPPHAIHVCMCHTPPRFLWPVSAGYTLGPGGIGRVVGAPLFWWLRRSDRAAAARVDYFLGNSRNVAARIAKYYGRNAEVLYPPVRLRKYSASEAIGDFYLVVSRLTHYKRIDVAVDACTKIGVPLVVVGDGPEALALRHRAGPTIRFRGRVGDVELRSLMARCRALILTAEEDFGLTPIEANAAGRPVIAYAAGGALETVVDGVTGQYFSPQSADALVEVLRSFDSQSFDRPRLLGHARQFDEPVFVNGIRNLVGRYRMERDAG